MLEKLTDTLVIVGSGLLVTVIIMAYVCGLALPILLAYYLITHV